MTALATQTSPKRLLLLASDRNDNAGLGLGRNRHDQGILHRIGSAFFDTVIFDATGITERGEHGINGELMLIIKASCRFHCQEN